MVSELVRKSFAVSDVFIFFCLFSSIMESFTVGYMFGNDSHITPVVERSSPITEIASFKITICNVDRVMDNRYVDDGTVHPGEHLLYIKLCDLFKIAGASRELIMRKLFFYITERKSL